MNSSIRMALRLALIVMVSGMLWVVISNDFLSGVASSKAVLARYYIYTEWLYVVISALLVYFLVKRVLDRQAADAEKLHRSEQQFRLFIEHSPVALAMLDRDMRYLAASNRWEEVFALGNKSFIGCSYDEVYPGFPERWKEFHRRGLNGEELQAAEDQVTRADGSVLWMRSGIRPWYAPDDSIGGIVIFAEDVTWRKQIEQALSASEMKFRLLFENSRDGLLTTSPPSWRFSSANRAAMRMFGANGEAEFTSLSPWELSPEYQPDGALSVEKAKQELDTALRQGSHFFEWTHKRLDGTTFPVEVQLTRIEMSGKAFIQGAIRDISERRKLEKDIQERRQEMEKLQKIQIASQTAAAIAHELNQPLTAILSYSQAAQLKLNSDHPDLQELRAAIEGLAGQSSRAGKSLRDMLLTLNISDFPVEVFDLNSEIRETLTLAKAEHELQFRSQLYLDEQRPLVLANRTHVQKALFNLLHNSIDAMQLAEISVPVLAVRVTSRLDEGVAQVTVQDNGPGIAEEMAHRLFQPFFTSKANGIGMGLVISRSLIEGNGGQLWVDPHEKPGATFHMTIPLAP